MLPPLSAVEHVHTIWPCRYCPGYSTCLSCEVSDLHRLKQNARVVLGAQKAARLPVGAICDVNIKLRVDIRDRVRFARKRLSSVWS